MESAPALPGLDGDPSGNVQPFGVERRFDPAFVARLALREKQVQQSYRPVISIHKWFARRPGSVFRSLMLSEYVDAPLDEAYWESNQVSGVVADPFMGGGTTLFEGLRLGLSAVGCDINPIASWLVRQAVEPLDVEEFRQTGDLVWQWMQDKVGDLYRTTCTGCGDDAPVKYFLWVKACDCPACGEPVSLFPGYRIAEAVRHPREVFVCPTCDRLHETERGSEPRCAPCSRSLATGNTRRRQAECLACGHAFAYADALASPPEHRLVAIEYRCEACYPSLEGRQFKSPDHHDHTRVSAAATRLADLDGKLTIPDDEIPEGDETTRLLRWGYRRFRELFNDRQLLGLGLLLETIRGVDDTRTRHGLATVFSDFLRYQNLLCRYDTYALKCQDIFSVHGFPVGLIACENNLTGIPKVGSGSFIHFVEKYAKAKRYAQEPYETLPGRGRRKIVRIEGESIEAPLAFEEPVAGDHAAWITCAASQDLTLAPDSLDGVFTDPPYFDNVQYAELMDFCFVWLRLLLDDEPAAFARETTRSERELTGNTTHGRDLENFTTGLSEVFGLMSEALKPGAPLVFTFHHNDPQAYTPLVVSLLDADLTCTAVLPAPAEMSASLHIAGTKSSILDSVFVCRHRDWVDRHSDAIPEIPASIDERVERDVAAMAEAGYTCTEGDVQCLRAGHTAGVAVRQLTATGWDGARPLAERMRLVREHMTPDDSSS